MLTKATVLLFTWFGKYTHYNTQKKAIFMRRTKRRFARSKVYYFTAYYHAKSHSLTRKVATCGCFMSRTLAQFTFDLQYKAMARQLNKTPVSSNERIEWFRDDMFIRRPPEVFTWQCKKHCQNWQKQKALSTLATKRCQDLKKKALSIFGKSIVKI